MGNEDPSRRTFNRAFEVFGQSTAASKPTEGSLHNPTSRGYCELFDKLQDLLTATRTFFDRCKGSPDRVRTIVGAHST
jgi:hypothetical protein